MKRYTVTFSETLDKNLVALIENFTSDGSKPGDVIKHILYCYLGADFAFSDVLQVSTQNDNELTTLSDGVEGLPLQYIFDEVK